MKKISLIAAMLLILLTHLHAQRSELGIRTGFTQLYTNYGDPESVYSNKEWPAEIYFQENLNRWSISIYAQYFYQTAVKNSPYYNEQAQVSIDTLDYNEYKQNNIIVGLQVQYNFYRIRNRKLKANIGLNVFEWMSINNIRTTQLLRFWGNNAYFDEGYVTTLSIKTNTLFAGINMSVSYQIEKGVNLNAMYRLQVAEQYKEMNGLSRIGQKNDLLVGVGFTLGKHKNVSRGTKSKNKTTM